MDIQKRCRHTKGKTGRARARAARSCTCTWGIYPWVDGTRRWIPLGPDEHEARVQALRMSADLMEGHRPRRRPGEGIDDVMAAWLAYRTAKGARVSSLHNYRAHIKRIDAFMGATPAADLRTEHVVRFAEKLSDAGLEARTVNGILSSLSGALRYAASTGMRVGAVDFKAATQAASDQKPWLMTVAECRRVIDGAPEPWGSMMEVGLLTGLRRGELLAVETGDVELDRRVLHVRETVNIEGGTNAPKSRYSTRAVHLTARTCELIAERVSVVGDGRLWPGTLHDATNAMRRTLDRLGLYRPKRGWHCLRNAHAALLNEAGISLRDAAARLGHGPNTAQSMAYGWAAEQVDADLIDDALSAHG